MLKDVKVEENTGNGFSWIYTIIIQNSIILSLKSDRGIRNSILKETPKANTWQIAPRGFMKQKVVIRDISVI